MSSANEPRHTRIALQWNINGLYNNLTDLQVLTEDNPPLVLALQELHRYTPSGLNNLLRGQYSWVTKNGPTRYQNVALAIHRSTTFDIVDLNTTLTAVAATVNVPFRLTVISIYLQHAGITNLESLLTELIDQLEGPFLIMGDMNGHHYAWGSRKTDGRGIAVLRVAEEKNLIVMNDGTLTFLRGDQQSAIDVTMASSSILGKLRWKIQDDSMGSDHCPIEIYGTDAPIEAKRRPRWKYDEANWDGFEETVLSRIVPDRQYSIEDLTDIILQAAKSNIPRTNQTPGKKSTHWWNAETKAAVKARRKALRTFKRLPADHPDKQIAVENLRKKRSECRKVVNEAKNKSWEEFIDGINATHTTTEIWRRVNALSGKRRACGMSIRSEGETTRDPAKVANILAKYFERISSTAAYSDSFISKNPITALSSIGIPNDPGGTKYNEPFSLQELYYALDASIGKSSGLDEVGYPMIRRLPYRAKIALLDAINQVWSSGIIPESWKRSLVVPIPKNGAASADPQNYRPISLTSCVSKIMERMVNRRLTTYLTENQSLDSRQFAFQRGRGTGTYHAVLGQVLDDALRANLHVDLAALDLSKAYNRVWSPGVLQQLIKWGITGNMAKFIKGFLSNRTFQVIVGNDKSNVMEEQTGVPQGSVLAVSLFLVAMNGVFDRLPKGIHIFVYADDILLVAVGANPRALRRKLLAGVRAVANWADLAGFCMAPGKSAISHCCNHRHHPWRMPLSVRGLEIPYKKVLRVLGVNIDRKLTFSDHFTSIKKETENRMRLIRAISGRHQSSNRKTIMQVSNALITTRLLYGSELTCRSAEVLISTLAPIYNRSIRFASGLLPSSPTLATCSEAGVLPFEFVVTKSIAEKTVSFLEKTYGGSEEIYLLREAKNLLQIYANGTLPPIAELHRVGDRSWDSIGPRIDWEMKAHVKAGDPSSKVLSYFNALSNRKYKDHTRIYTDGSRANGEVGIGIYSPYSTIASRLPDWCSIFSAEAAAIRLALRNVRDEAVVIFSDSASVLSALEAGKSKHPWIQEIEEVMPTTATLCWVPGHCGVRGNIEADRLAAAGRTMVQRIIPSPGADIKKKVKNDLKTAWENRWFRERNLFLRKIKDSTETWKDRPNQKEQRILSRLRVGHTRLTHPHYFSSEQQPRCEACSVHLTVEHILAHCPRYQQQRNSLQLKHSIRDILSNDPNEENKLILFLEHVGLYNKI